jgi:hypothetical protein
MLDSDNATQPAAPATVATMRDEVTMLRDALDHIARVALGSTSHSRRAAWIAARAVSALNGDDDWRSCPRPKGYHEALER